MVKDELETPWHKRTPIRLRTFLGEGFLERTFAPVGGKTKKQALVEVHAFCKDGHWIQGQACMSNGPISGCLIGAVGLSCGWDPLIRMDGDGRFYEMSVDHKYFPLEEGWALYEETLQHLAEVIKPSFEGEYTAADDFVVEWNDMDGRYKADVLDHLAAAIEAAS